MNPASQTSLRRDRSDSPAPRTTSRRDRSRSPAPRTTSKKNRPKSQAPPKRHRSNSPSGARRDRHRSPAPARSPGPPRQDRHQSPDQQCPDSRSSSRMSRSNLSSWGSRTHSKLGPRTPPPSNRVLSKTSKRSRDYTPTSKRTKHKATDRVDVLQVIEPRDNRSVWNTQMIEDFMNDQQRARTVLQYKVFQKELNP